MIDCTTCRSWQKTDRMIGWCIFLRRFTVTGISRTKGCYVRRNEAAEKLEREIIKGLWRGRKKR